MNTQKIYNIFCDESRQDLLARQQSINKNNCYCCIGGLMIPLEARNRIKSEIQGLQKKYNTYGELKWGTVSRNKINFYLDLIDYFFEEPELSFRTIVIDARKINNTIYNDSDQELGYYKFYYQMLVHWLNPNATYRIYTDQKTNRDKQRLKELKLILNRSYYCKSPVQSIQAIDSNQSLVLQMENILMGGVGYKYNWNHTGISSSKNLLVQKIESHLNHEICHTDKSEAKFNVFVISLKGGC